jgi:putative addiction module component (TIGR02574 family)
MEGLGKCPGKTSLASALSRINLFHMSTTAVAPRLLKLPKKKRLELAERLWLSVADETSMPVPESHKRILRQRLADFKAGRIKTISHDELMRRVRAS